MRQGTAKLTLAGNAEPNQRATTGIVSSSNRALGGAFRTGALRVLKQYMVLS